MAPCIHCSRQQPIILLPLASPLPPATNGFRGYPTPQTIRKIWRPGLQKLLESNKKKHPLQPLALELDVGSCLSIPGHPTLAHRAYSSLPLSSLIWVSCTILQGPRLPPSSPSLDYTSCLLLLAPQVMFLFSHFYLAYEVFDGMTAHFAHASLIYLLLEFSCNFVLGLSLGLCCDDKCIKLYSTLGSWLFLFMCLFG